MLCTQRNQLTVVDKWVPAVVWRRLSPTVLMFAASSLSKLQVRVTLVFAFILCSQPTLGLDHETCQRHAGLDDHESISSNSD